MTIRRSVVIAAHDAPDSIKQVADFICDGVDDIEELHAAVEMLDNGGVILLEGSFEFRTRRNDDS